MAQKLWPKRSGLLWPHHLHNESKFSWNAFLSSAIRGFYQNNTKICSFFVHFCSFQSFSATSDQLLHLIHITSCLASRILLTLKKWELYLLRWLRYQAESIRSWRGIRWSDDLIRRSNRIAWHAHSPMGTSLRAGQMTCPTTLCPCITTRSVKLMRSSNCSIAPVLMGRFTRFFSGKNL